MTITAAGFAERTFSGLLHPGEAQEIPPIMLNIAAARTTMQVGLPRAEVAEEQMTAEEKQRILGISPDFHVSHVPNAAPLGFQQKFNPAWKATSDSFTFVLGAAIAGMQQLQNYFKGHGQGFKGYAKRYGADYANTVTANFIGDAILPSLLKQDPRYFYKGTGITRSRILCTCQCSRLQRRQWTMATKLLPSPRHFAAAGIWNVYYPASDRHGAALTFENGAIGIAGTEVANLFQEFVVRNFTPSFRISAGDRNSRYPVGWCGSSMRRTSTCNPEVFSL